MLDSSTTPDYFAHLLGIPLQKLTYMAYVKKDQDLYEEFEIRKKNGGVRVIQSPCNALKFIQDKIKVLLEDIYIPSSSASAFIAGRGIVYNAKKHTKKKYVFNIDLEDFYGQIHFGRILGLLKSKPFSLDESTARLIANLCCCNGTIPQGAPTSPVISNMICKKLDRELSYIAKRNKSYYSRYADDITFSFSHEKPNDIVDFISGEPKKELINIINANGFLINSSKTRLSSSKERQVVTGLKVNKKINLDRRYIRTTRAMIFSLSRDAVEARKKFREKNKEKNSTIETSIAGRINFIGMIKGKDSTVFQGLARKFNSINTNIKITTYHDSNRSSLPIYIERERIEMCVWVVSFEGIDELELDQQLVVGTAFAVEGKIITANHTFDKSGSTTCYLYRINNPCKKYEAVVEKYDRTCDIAVLSFVGEHPKEVQSFKIAPNSNLYQGYQLVLAGFPQLQPGHSSATIIPCTVINNFTRSTLSFIEINENIAGGNSGGPLLNIYMQVVGMAVTGIRVSTEDNKDFILEGNNACIASKHFHSFIT